MLVRFITLVASRFGVVLTQKFAAQALPLVGALGGASVNYVFIEHFQDMAQGHFTVRKPVAGTDKLAASHINARSARDDFLLGS